MEALIIKGDETTPNVFFNGLTGNLEMGGVAIPEDVREITKPILEWITSYSQSPKPATLVEFYFEYLNTAATKMVFQLCDSVNLIHKEGKGRVRLTWKYNRGDLEMLDLGEEVFEGFECQTEIIAMDK